MHHLALWATESQPQNPVYDFFEQHYILEFHPNHLGALPKDLHSEAHEGVTVIFEFADQTQQVIDDAHVLLLTKASS